MWISAKAFSWFGIAREVFDGMKEELAAVRAERDTIARELAAVKVTSDWLRMRVNALELERTALLERAYNIQLPVPELMRPPSREMQPIEFAFDDIGDEAAKQLGYPLYGLDRPNAE